MAKFKNTKTPVAKTETKNQTMSAEKATPVAVVEKAVAAKQTTEKQTAEKKTVESKPVAEKKVVESKAAATEKKTVKKPAEKKTTRTRRAKKPVEKVQEVYFEYQDEQIQAESLVARIQEAYKAEGHRVGAIKSLKVYINPVEHKAYYVINDKAEGKFIEF